MKILRLDLLAFGPFTGLPLALDEGRQGLHIVYGPNEAGKTSTLRALRTLFYGFDPQCPDAFLHAYKDLRVGAVLHDGNGQTLECIRRKGNKNTLRGADDAKIIDEAELRHLLGGVGEESFCRQFGICYADLVQGGEEIVEGGGEIGQILFAAASGLAHLNEVRRTLADEADALFSPAATVKPINRKLSELKAQRKAAKEAQLSSGEWKKHRDSLAAAEAQCRELEAKQRRLGAELARLERISRALPEIARRRETLNELEQLGAAPLLSVDFADRRRRAELERTKADLQQRNATDSIESLTRDMEQLDVCETVLARADDIQALKDELGVHEKAARDSRDRAREREQLLREAGEILREIGREDLRVEAAEELRLTKEERLRIQRLAAEYGKLIEREDQTGQRVAELVRSLSEAEAELQRLPPSRDTAPLSRALARLQKQGDLTSRLAALESEWASATRQAEIELKRLPRWSGTLAELERLAAPSAETIAEFEKRLDGAAKECERWEGEFDQTRRRVSELDERLQQLDLEHDVPTVNDLADARARRDEGWRLVRAALRGDDAPPTAEFLTEFHAGTLEEAFQQSVRRADEVADRLHREAERVGEKSQLLAQHVREQKHLEELDPQRRFAAERQTACQYEWRSHWLGAGIEPLSPREMRAWLGQKQELVEAAGLIRRRTEELHTLRTQRDDHRRELLARLNELGVSVEVEAPSLDDLVAICEESLRNMGQCNADRNRLDGEVQRQRREWKSAAEELRQAGEDLTKWRIQWRISTQRLRLEEADPDIASAMLEEIHQLFIKIGEADKLSRRIADMANDMESFSQKVKFVREDLAPDLAQAPYGKVVAELYQQLEAAKKASSRRTALQKQLAEATRKYAAAQELFQNAEAELAALCQEAGCASTGELAPVEEKAALRRELLRRLEEIETRLHAEAAGRPLAEFIDEALAVAPDRLPAEIASIQQQLEAAGAAWGETNRLLGAEQTELDKMDGNARAAEAQEEVEQLLAQVRDDAERYARLRLAAEVLRGAIQRHRERNQGPVVRRASELFRDLTLGSFAGLRVDYDESGKAILVGVRESGQTVPVDGMSDGSCDQLYLALRLASLEHYLQDHPPLPFIVDDILITFDDDRAAAALAALADLSRRTQVIFFTHHHRLVELAGRLPKGVVFVHQLPSPLASTNGRVQEETVERTLFA